MLVGMYCASCHFFSSSALFQQSHSATFPHGFAICKHSEHIIAQVRSMSENHLRARRGRQSRCEENFRDYLRISADKIPYVGVLAHPQCLIYYLYTSAAGSVFILSSNLYLRTQQVNAFEVSETRRRSTTLINLSAVRR